MGSSPTVPWPLEPFRPDLIEEVHQIANAAMDEIGATFQTDGPVGLEYLTPEAIQAMRVAFISTGIEYEEVWPATYRVNCAEWIREHGKRRGLVALLSRLWPEVG